MSTMIDCIATRFSSSLAHADGVTYPFRHWLLNRILPDGSCMAIDAG